MKLLLKLEFYVTFILLNYFVNFILISLLNWLFIIFTGGNIMLLYTYEGNFRAYKALIAAQFSGANVKIAPNFVFGETNKSETFLKKFPLGKVSVLSMICLLLSSFSVILMIFLTKTANISLRLTHISVHLRVMTL